ncbi:hypothetical protein BDP27DRAFT_1431213 [Rhodocollybia butyracea]|uniref:Uncharacterized protein n=1 Tax=Rhodocollybia butyracea TaxID=206335 RepID=A0A9P5TYQ0_9AGAR|nr:hypothetical protein BDP27DRAFT_1431213 [Rhodocollybia butyracea]
MVHLIYRLLGVVALWASYIHCQLTLYQASNDVFGLASATLQEVGIADGATTYVHVVSLAPDSIVLETVVVSASGFTEDTDNTLYHLIITGGCQFVAATSVSCEIGNPFSTAVNVGTPLPFEVAVETMLVTSQGPSTSTSSGITPQAIGTFPSPTVSTSSITGKPMPSLYTSVPSSATGISVPTPSAVIGGVLVGGIILLSLISVTCCGASQYNDSSSPNAALAIPQQVSEDISHEELAAHQKQVAEELERVINVETSNRGTVWSTHAVRGITTTWWHGEKKN